VGPDSAIQPLILKGASRGAGQVIAVHLGKILGLFTNAPQSSGYFYYVTSRLPVNILRRAAGYVLFKILVGW
jgi:hypothetical protein